MKRTGLVRTGRPPIAKIDILASYVRRRVFLPAQNMANWLEAEGYRITTYTDGASALDGFKTAPPDLAILDIKMPRMDGMETCAACGRNPICR